MQTRIRKMVAIILLLMIAMSFAVEALAENSDAFETSEPTVTEVTVSEEPKAPEAPVATPAPVVTPAPAASEPPAATEEPTASTPPVATEAPEVAQTPEATETPVETEEPECTATATPEASATPLPTAAPAGDEDEAENQRAYVLIEGGTAKVYAEPSTDSEVLARLGRGASVSVVANGDWALIQVGDIQGYIQGEFLSFEPVSDLPAKETPSVDESAEEEEQEAGDAVDTPDAEGTDQELPVAPRAISIYCMNTQIAFGDKVTLGSKLEGYDGVAVALQWQRLTSSGEWVDVSGANGAQFSFVMTEELEGANWRLEVIEIGA